MSANRGRSIAARDAQIRRELEPDVGPLDDDADCDAGPCTESAVFAVPAPEGGEARYCPYHVAWFRQQNPEIWERLEAAPERVLDEDPNDFATVGNRFVALADAPETLADDTLVRVALLVNGQALYESEEPDEAETVDYVAVNRRLDVTASAKVPVEKAGEWLRGNRRKYGWLAVEDDVVRALHGDRDAPVGGDGQ
ncbi:hypothetical protein [Halobaculum sp. P14]|uniref:hypothetical protein n=1 Tax=Halobaculum sp. P14 TaxID=3421638 RepID=UPI003EBE9DC4